MRLDRGFCRKMLLGECFFDASRPERGALTAAWAEIPMGTRPARLSPLRARILGLDERSGRQLSSSASLRAAEPTWEPNVLGGQSVLFGCIEAREGCIDGSLG